MYGIKGHMSQAACAILFDTCVRLHVQYYLTHVSGCMCNIIWLLSDTFDQGYDHGSYYIE